jgi:hypothetical protein
MQSGNKIMQYIGTSLGRCLRSILLGEVSIDQVFLISAGTRSETKEQYLNVVKGYYQERDMYSDYDLKPWPWQEVEELAVSLWNSGKIHQPRNFGAQPFFRDDKLWIEIFPPHLLRKPAAKDLWEKLTVIARLYE